MEKLKHGDFSPSLIDLSQPELISMALRGPHDCGIAQCPGDINRRKLEAAEEMARALETAKSELNPRIGKRSTIEQDDLYCQIDEALCRWEKAGKEEG